MVFNPAMTDEQKARLGELIALWHAILKGGEWSGQYQMTHQNIEYRNTAAKNLRRGCHVLIEGIPRFVQRVIVGYGDPEQVGVVLEGLSMIRLWDMQTRVLTTRGWRQNGF